MSSSRLRAGPGASFLVLVSLLACLLLTAFVYRTGFDGGFMLDDYPNVVQAYIANPDRDAIFYTVTHNGSGLLGRSVSMLSFVLSGLQYGLDAWGYKYHNLLLHLLIGVLLFRLLLTLLPQLLPGASAQRQLLVAALVTALWLLHPLQVSTVLYVVQRMTQLAALFIVLALLAWLQARRSDNSPGRYLLYGWVLFPLCSLLAVLSKETGALIPLYVGLIEIVAYGSGPARWRAEPRLALLTGVFVGLPLLLGTVLLMVGFESLVDYSTRTFTLEQRLLSQVHALFFYLRLILLPRLRDMSLFHDDFPLTTTLDASTVALGLLLLALTGLCWRLRQRAPWVCFGLLWFFVSHAMESTIFPLELVFEHRNYLALAGLLLVPAGFACRPAQALAPALTVCLAVLLLFTGMTALRAAEWGNRELFHAMAVADNPASPRALNNQINHLLGRGDHGQVLQLLQRQVEIAPAEAGAYMHLQLVSCDVDGKDPVLWQRTEALLGERPVSVYTLNALQALVVQVIDGRCQALSLDDMERLVDLALEQPGNRAHAGNHAALLRMRGLLAFARGLYAQGYAWLMTAHEHSPTADILGELIGYQVMAGRFGDAEETLQLLERQSARRFGTEAYPVRLARQRLEQGRRDAMDAANGQNRPESAATP